LGKDHVPSAIRTPLGKPTFPRWTTHPRTLASIV
jgi:hypothetical protein